MKAVIEFDLPEEQYEYDRCNSANKMVSFLTEFTKTLRNNFKYGGESKTTWEKVYELWWKNAQEEGIENFLF